MKSRFHFLFLSILKIASICSIIHTQNFFCVVVNACLINCEKLLHIIMVIVKLNGSSVMVIN